MAQLVPPSFRAALAGMPFAFIAFDDLCEHCDALCKFGDDYTILQKIARQAPALL
jgi:type II restriction enzyme